MNCCVACSEGARTVRDSQMAAVAPAPVVARGTAAVRRAPSQCPPGGPTQPLPTSALRPSRVPATMAGGNAHREASGLPVSLWDGDRAPASVYRAVASPGEAVPAPVPHMIGSGTDFGAVRALGASRDCPPHEKLSRAQRDLRSRGLVPPALGGGAASPLEAAAPRGALHVIPAHHEAPIVIPAQERKRLTAGSRPAVISMLGAGRPLTLSESRAFPGWGDALGNVRIHDDLQTQLVAALLGDVGFAAGHHIGLGDSSGSSPERQWLLAHELTHVMQQRASAPRPASRDPEREAEHIADLVTRGNRDAMLPWPAAASPGLAQRVIARYTQDLPGNMLLVIDVDDGDFVGGCVRAIVPHLGVKLILKGVPRGAGNQLFNLHVGITTNAAGETCFFFYESVSGLCEMTCFPTLDELKKRLGELRDWLKEKIEQLLTALLPAVPPPRCLPI